MTTKLRCDVCESIMPTIRPDGSPVKDGDACTWQMCPGHYRAVEEPAKPEGDAAYWRARAEKAEADLEKERMRVVACGAVACADTPTSAKSTRVMHPDYKSASCDDVARRVDECIYLRAEVDRLRKLLDAAQSKLLETC